MHYHLLTCVAPAGKGVVVRFPAENRKVVIFSKTDISILVKKHDLEHWETGVEIGLGIEL